MSHNTKGLTTLEIISRCRSSEEICETLRTLAKADAGCAAGHEDTFALGYLAAYVAMLHRDADQGLDDEPRPLSDAEIDELLVNVSISKLERLLHDRKSERADTVEEINETLEIASPWCHFPGCPNDRRGDDLFCEAHVDECAHVEVEFDHAVNAARCVDCGEVQP